MAAKKGETALAVGNVIGSNLFNMMFILGLSAAIHPVAVNAASFYDMLILIAVSLMLPYDFGNLGDRGEVAAAGIRNDPFQFGNLSSRYHAQQNVLVFLAHETGSRNAFGDCFLMNARSLFLLLLSLGTSTPLSRYMVLYLILFSRIFLFLKPMILTSK